MCIYIYQVACRSKQPCFYPESDFPEFKIWNRIHNIDSNHRNGSLCINMQMSGIAKGKSGEDLTGLCQEWVDAGQPGGEKHQWLINLQESLGRRFDFYAPGATCEALAVAVEKHCTFDIKTVAEFTKASQKNGGDMSITFWYRPSGHASLIGDKFMPSIAFYSSLFPPEHNLVLGGFTSNPRGEVRVHTNCRDLRDDTIFESVQTNQASVDGWTFFSYVRRNSSVLVGNASVDKSNTIVNNIGVNRRPSDPPLCLYNSSVLFNAIEVNYPLQLSPISLFPLALSMEQVQTRYYASNEAMSVRRGPVAPFRNTVPVNLKQYQHRSSLVAPPMVFQVRQNTSTCDYQYSNEWVNRQHKVASEELCSGDFECQSAIDPVSCSGPTENGTYFGLKRVKYGAETGYADMLYSLSEYKELYRDDKLQQTSRFVDAHTSELSIEMVLFSPNSGVLSFLTIHNDLLRAEGVAVSFTIQFFNILDGVKLMEYAVLEVLAMFVILVVLSHNTLSKLYKDYKHKHLLEDKTMSELSVIVGDALQIILVPITIAIRMNEKFKSNDQVKTIVESWAAIEWKNDTIPLRDKKEAFFEGVLALKASIDTLSSAKLMVFLALLISLMRMLQETSLHPRLALLTGTVGFAAGHMLHALLVAAFVMCSFAAIGVWRFGSKLHDFSTFQNAMAFEMTMLFAPDPITNWHESFELAVFTLLLLFTMVLLVLNFLLAIIVESYMQVRKEIEKCLIEQSFFEDLVSVLHVHMVAWWYKWPALPEMACRLGANKVKLSIGYKELQKLHVFPNHESIVAFLNYYQRYDFLRPELVTKYGRKPKTIEESVAALVERRIAMLMGREPLTLKEISNFKPTFDKDNEVLPANYRHLRRINSLAGARELKGRGRKGVSAHFEESAHLDTAPSQPIASGVLSSAVPSATVESAEQRHGIDSEHGHLYQAHAYSDSCLPPLNSPTRLAQVSRQRARESGHTSGPREDVHSIDRSAALPGQISSWA